MATIMLALMLLSLCVFLYSASQENQWLKKYLPKFLYLFGIIPGFCGVIYGFIAYVVSGKPLVILSAFLLLELASDALLRANKKM